MSTLKVFVEGKDSAFQEGLSRDLGQDIAEDTSFLVYDLRKKNSRVLDSIYGLDKMHDKAILSAMSGGSVSFGIIVECKELKEALRCRVESVSMGSGEGNLVDTLFLLSEAMDKRKLLSQAIARPLIAYFFPKKHIQLNMGLLKLVPPANPAMLVRGVQIMKKGIITEIPIGCTLVIGDSPKLIVINMDNSQFILYPHSSYTYMLPKVLQINQGSLGIFKTIDSSSVEGKLRSVTALDNSNLIWRSLAKVASLDSNNLLWKGLGRVTSLDSHNLILSNLAKVTSLDSTNLLLRTLTQVAAMDSSNLIWKGLGQVSELDSNNLIWKKLNQIASLDSNSIWSKLGLLAFQDNTVVLTPSMIARGKPQVVLFRHEGGMSTLEVVKGTMSTQPLLSSQPPQPVGVLRVVRSRGYSMKQERLNPVRAEKIIQELESANLKNGARNLIQFLPGKLFSQGSALRTPERSIQSFISFEFRETDLEIDILSSEKESWSELNGSFPTGAERSGCYLCSPDRLGP